MKTREEIEKLKSNWHDDPNWDIENTEGFEEHRQELLEFRKQSEKKWAYLRQKEHDRLASFICPVMSLNETALTAHCQVEKCAWWNSSYDKCGMILQSYLVGWETSRRER